MQNLEQLFQGLDIKDPKIRASKNTIYLFPYYWNFAFVSTFLLVLIAVWAYIYKEETSEITNPWFLIIIILSPILLVIQLKYYNSIIINFSEKTISVIPNLALRLFVKKKIIAFEDVKEFETMSNASLDSYRAMFRRYIIVAVLKNSDKIKLLSTTKYPIAKEIAKKLSLIVK